MHFGAPIFLLLSLCTCVSQVTSAPGRWEQLVLIEGTVVNLADIGFSPIHDHSLVFGVQACEQFIITFSELLDNSQGYVMVYIGFQENNFTLLVPSTHCDETGQCNPTDYVEGHFLDCDNPKYFWMEWDNHGILELGNGWIIGQDLILHTNYSGDFSLNSVTFRVNHEHGGVAVVNIDTPPKFIAPSAYGTHSVEVEETEKTGVDIFTLKGKDRENDNITFSVVGDFADMFKITGNKFYNVQPLDFETRCSFDVTISASDQAGEVNTTLTVRIGDVIDETPQLFITQVTIPEELAIGTAVDGGFVVRDQDKNDTEHFTITGPHSDYFTILEDWKFEIRKRIDFENGLFFLDQLVLTVIDSAGLNSSAALNITILDMNDNPPVFSQPVYYAFVTEHSQDDELITINCTDADSGLNGAISITLTSGHEDSNGAAFTFDSATSKIQTVSNNIDYETLADKNYTYVLTLMAVDTPVSDIPNTAYAAVIVTVLPINDWKPGWTQTIDDITLSETSPVGTFVTTFAATDDDHGPEGDIYYSITSIKLNDQSGSEVFGMFAIDSCSGNITVAGDLDTDKATGGVPSYYVTVQAADGGNPRKTAEKGLTINLKAENDNAPDFTDADNSALIAENANVGDKVYTFTVVDKDDNSYLSYTLGGNGKDVFEIQNSDIVTKAALDYETNSFYTVLINATDGENTVTKVMNIIVEDVIDEIPVITVITPLSYREKLPLGMVLGILFEVEDRDINDTLTYSLSGDDAKYFKINPDKGTLSIAQVIDINSANTVLSLFINVTDSSGQTASANLPITITDVIDNSPNCSADLKVVNLTENTVAGTVLCTVSCIGANPPDIRMNVVSGDDTPGRFSVNDNTLVTSNNPVDFEALPDGMTSYTLTLEATSSPSSPNKATIVVFVQVIGINEHTPVMEGGSGPLMVTVGEDLEPGGVITQVNATDQDTGPDGEVMFKVVEVKDDSGKSASGVFRIDPYSGILTSIKPLDRDVDTGGVSFYNVTVEAYDQGMMSKEVELQIDVIIENVNDNAPYFHKLIRQKTVSEVTSVGDVVTAFRGIDADGDDLTCSIVGGDSDYFSIQGTSIQLQKKLDFEMQSFFYIIINMFDGLNNASETVIIQVDDVIDEPPELMALTPAQAVGNLPVGTVMHGLFRVSDKDNGDSLNYSLSGNHSSYLEINSTSGEIQIRKSLGSLGSPYLDQVTLRVEDQAGLSDTQQLNISIITVSGNTPTFSKSLYNANITENTLNVTLVTLNFTDPDAVQSGDVIISVVSGDDVNVFSVNGLDLIVSGNVDYESLEEQDYKYILTLKTKATGGDDGGDSSNGGAAAIVIVNVQPLNEFSPVWDLPVSNSTDISIFENETIGTVITSVGASDADSGVDGTITYSVVSTFSSEGNVLKPPFSIDTTSGELRVSGNVDRDLATGGVEFYSLIIQAQDGGQSPNAITRNVTITLINVNDNPPTLGTLASIVRVPENVSVGSNIYTLTSGSDIDGDVVTFSVVEGDVTYFQLVNGSLCILKELDYENKTLHSIMINVNDGKFSSNVSVTVYVDDVIDETPVLNIFEPVNIQEELSVNTTLGGIFSVKDMDQGDNLTFNLQGADSKYLRFNPSTKELQIAERINRDGPTGVVRLTNITLTVTDSSGLSTSKTFSVDIVDIDDNPPVFSQIYYYATVDENSTYVNIVNLSLTDVDMASDDNLILNIVDGNSDSLFNLTNAMLYVDGARLDYESSTLTGNTYMLTVTTNGGTMTGTTVVVVEVEPKNEFAPNWVTPIDDQGYFPNVTIYENATVGTEVVNLMAIDTDMGDDGTLMYQITNAGITKSSMFNLDDRTGVLRLSGVLDYDVGTGGSDVYEIAMEASDKGHPPLTIEGKVRILVLNTNDNAPTVTSSVRSIRVLENASIDDELLTVPTVDKDGDTVTLSIVDGNDVIEVKGSALILKKAVDDMPGSCPTIVLRASDGELYNDYSYLIQVTNVNVEEANIKFPASFSIPEEIPTGTVLGGLFTVISDGGSTLQFTLKESGTDFLEMDYKTGEVTVKDRIDRDGVNGISSINDVVIAVTDNLGRVISQTMNIDITDINDNVPTFNQSIYTASVKENSQDGPVLTISCEDLDSAQNGLFVLSLQGDTQNGLVSLVGNSVNVKAYSWDYDTITDDATSLTMTLEAVDQSDDFRFTSQATILVQMEPVNEFAPLIADPALKIRVKEDTGVGSLLYRLNATDDDRGVDGQLTYTLISVLDDTTTDALDKFEVHPSTGELRLLVGLDTDTSTGGVSSYVVTYKVNDGGVPSKETQGQITLSLVPVNEHTPKLKPSRDTIDIKEDAAMSFVAYTFAADDADGDNVTFSVSGNLFRFKGSDLTLSQKLDFDTDNCKLFTVSATDGKFTASVSFSLNVIKANVTGVAAPKIRALSSPSVLEEQPVGTIVSLFQSVDGGNPPLLYTLSGDQGDYFSIDSSTGEIKLAKLVDFDGLNGTKVLDQVTLTVNDSAQLQDWVTFNIAVIDLNDNSPMCNNEHVIKVAENTRKGLTLGSLDCYDIDGSEFGKFNPSIVRNGVLDSFFTISNMKILTSDTKVDYEAIPEGSSNMIQVILTDNPNGNVHLSTTVFVKVQILSSNEYSPVWNSTKMINNSTFADVTVNENVTIGTVVAVFTAIDMDAGEHGAVSYLLKSVTTDNGDDVTSLFSLDYDTGHLRTVAMLDADIGSKTNVTYNVVAVATDQAYAPYTIEGYVKLVVVNINDNPPTLGSAEQQISIYENASIGDVIYSFQASDVDGDAVTFKVIGDILKVVGSSMILNNSLDFEKERCTTVEIIAEDDLFSVKSTIIINVLNINDETPVIQTNGIIGILEEQPIGTLVAGAFVVTDRDEDDTLTYSLDGNNSLFDINSTTGQLMIKQTVDFEQTLNVTDLRSTLRVTDDAGHVASANLVFSVSDINDNTPVCSRQMYEVNVTENVDDNSTVLTLQCTDADGGSNGEITLAITKGNEDNTFNVSGLSLTIGEIDYDGLGDMDFTYTLTVAVSDNSTNEARRTAYVIVVVNVLPNNEFDPYWMYPILDDSGQFPSLSIQEDITPGSVIETYTAGDPDEGRDGQIKYSITSVVSDTGVSSINLFSIDENTGRLVTSSALDYDVTTGGSSYYNISIRAEDTAISPKYTSGLLSLALKNYNDNPPKFSKTLYSIRVTCDKSKGDLLSTLSTTDADTSELKTAINGSSRFVYVDLDKGSIILLYTPEELALKHVTSDIFVVVVSDRGKPELRDYSTVYLVFDNCNRPTVPTTTTTTTTTTSTTTTTTEATTVLTVNETTTNQERCSQPRGQILELWATRTICGMLGVGMIGLLAYHLKTSRAKTNAVSENAENKPPKKNQGHLSLLERGDNCDKKIRIEDLLNSESGLGPPDVKVNSMLSSSAPLEHPRMRYEP